MRLVPFSMLMKIPNIQSNMGIVGRSALNRPYWMPKWSWPGRRYRGRDGEIERLDRKLSGGKQPEVIWDLPGGLVFDLTEGGCGI